MKEDPRSSSGHTTQSVTPGLGSSGAWRNRSTDRGDTRGCFGSEGTGVGSMSLYERGLPWLDPTTSRVSFRVRTGQEIEEESVTFLIDFETSDVSPPPSPSPLPCFHLSHPCPHNSSVQPSVDLSRPTPFMFLSHNLESSLWCLVLPVTPVSCLTCHSGVRAPSLPSSLLLYYLCRVLSTTRKTSFLE